jgi:hypothetical protein
MTRSPESLGTCVSGLRIEVIEVSTETHYLEHTLHTSARLGSEFERKDREQDEGGGCGSCVEKY